jgi:hypothetical protein
MTKARSAIIGLCALIAGSQASAASRALPSEPPGPMVWESWPVLAEDRDGECRLEILGNGKFLLLRATGLGSAETGQFQVSNPQMVPVDWRVVSDNKGVFVRAFLPNLWRPQADLTVRDYQSSGLVSARISTGSCNLTASAPWKQEIRVIP